MTDCIMKAAILIADSGKVLSFCNNHEFCFTELLVGELLDSESALTESGISL